jgi:hypothetical protein
MAAAGDGSMRQIAQRDDQSAKTIIADGEKMPSVEHRLNGSLRGLATMLPPHGCSCHAAPSHPWPGAAWLHGWPLRVDLPSYPVAATGSF